MPNKRLSEKDIDQLLTQYRSERRRLSFQLETVRKAIKDLKGVRTTTPNGTATPSDGSVIKRGPGRPRKTDAERVASAPQKNGRRKKRQIKDGGYRLSDWDSMVIDTIGKSDRLLPKEEILQKAITGLRKHILK